MTREAMTRETMTRYQIGPELDGQIHSIHGRLTPTQVVPCECPGGHAGAGWLLLDDAGNATPTVAAVPAPSTEDATRPRKAKP